MVEDGSRNLALLPSMEAILSDERLGELGGEPRPLVRAWARESLDALRAEIRAGVWRPADRSDALERVVEEVRGRARGGLDLRLRSVWNATGILLHTNLGRAVLPAEARRALLQSASGYSSLEVDLATGRRASRSAAIRELIPLLTGAEAGFAVNNNAAAVFLAVATLARGREVLVSRGQLVEIGGSFRLPEILEAAGVRLREVGTTNRTRIGDYENARSTDTGLVLYVHRSNFRMVGFTEEPSFEELVTFCRRERLVLLLDIGSGALRAHRDLFPDEPLVEDAVESGADLVCFSADKLLGLCQAGILAGRSELIEERILRHPIARIVRLDKTLLTALEAGLRLHLRGAEVARREIPLFRALSRTPESLAAAAERSAERLRARLPGEFEVATTEIRGEVGGGSLPGLTIPSHGATLRGGGMNVDRLAELLRGGNPPVIGRIQEDRLLLDLRAIEEEDEEAFVDAVLGAIEQRSAH